MTTKFIAVTILIVFLMFVVELIRRQKLSFKYAFGWLCVTLIALFLAVFDRLLFDLASMAGFVLPSNFIFFTVMSVMALLTLLMTVFLCEQNSRNDAMAQKIAQLQCDLDQIKKNADKG